MMAIQRPPVAQVKHLQIICAWRACTANREKDSVYCAKHRPGFRLVSPPEKRVVYFVQCNGEDGPIKIGKSSCWAKRFNGMTTDNPYPIVVLALVTLNQAWQMDALEKGIHRHLAKHRVRGEWFEACRSVRKVVEAAKTLSTVDFCVTLGIDLETASR